MPDTSQINKALSPENALQQQFWKLTAFKLAIVLLMLMPTVLFVVFLNDSDLPAKEMIIEAWQAKLFSIQGLSVKTSRIVMDVLLFVGIGLWGLLYVKGARLLNLNTVSKDETTQKRWVQIILLAAALLSLLLIAVIPFQSRDIYGYINRGAQQAFYGINPYLVTVGQMPNWQSDPLFMNHWLDNPCPYGFLFAWLVKGLVGLSAHQFVNAFVIIKAFNVGVHLLSAWLVYQLACRFKCHNPAFIMYLFALNPLILLQLIANGHNDGLTAMLALASVWVLSKRRFDWACLPLLLLSVLTKYATLLLLPFIVIYLLFQKNWKALLWGGLISLGLAAMLAGLYLPSGDEVWPAAKISGNAGISQHSLHSALSRLVYYLTGQQESVLIAMRQGLKPLFWGVFAVGYFASIWQLFKATLLDKKPLTLQRVLETGAWWMTVMLFLASSKFNAWYVAMVFPLGLLSGQASRLCQLMILLSLFHLASFTPLENIHVLNFFLLTGLPFYLAFGTERFTFKAS